MIEKIDTIIGLILNMPVVDMIGLILGCIWFFGAFILIYIVIRLNIDILHERLMNWKQNREEADGQS